jgi:hypothetical protein
MTKTYQEIIDFQIIAAIRQEKEKKSGKQTKLGYAIKKLCGDVSTRLKGKLADVAKSYEEKKADILIDLASVDENKDLRIGTDGNYKYTQENRKKLEAQIKALNKQTAEFEPYFCSEIPDDLTEAEAESYLDFVIDKTTFSYDTYLEKKKLGKNLAITENDNLDAE